MLLLFLTLSDEQQDFVVKLFHKYNNRFLLIAAKYVRSRALAEEVVSESYVKIMKNIDKIMEFSHDEVRAYCVTIVKNEAINCIHKECKYTSMEDFYEVEDGSDSMSQFKSDKNFEELLADLSAEERRIMQMHYLLQMGYQEIADTLGIEYETVKKRGQRTLKKLRAAMAAYDN